MARAVALGVLLCVGYEVVRAAFPLVPLGVTAVRAVAPRVLSSAATNPASVSVVSGGLRVTATQGASIAGMGALVTVRRTASGDAVAAAMLGLGVASLAGSELVNGALDEVDCALGGTEYNCAPTQAKAPQPVSCGTMGLQTGICGGVTQRATEYCVGSAAEWGTAVAEHSARAGWNGRVVSTGVLPGGGFRATIAQRAGSWECGVAGTAGATINTSRNTFTTTPGCPAGFEQSKREPDRCRPVDRSTWLPTPATVLRDRLAATDSWLSVPLGGWLGQRGVEVPDAGAPTVVVDAPASIRLGDYVREWELPDGSIVRETTEWRADQTWEDDVITSRTRAERRVEPSGAVVPSTPPTREESRLPPPVPGGGVTPAPAPTPTEPPEDKECGLPGTPPCKIDETGTPTGEAVTGPEAIEPVVDQLESCISNPASCLPALPSLSWNFALPTNCSAIPTPAFSPALEEIDVCAFQPTIHDLMSVVWMLGGLFGAIGLFWRKTLAS